MCRSKSWIRGSGFTVHRIQGLEPKVYRTQGSGVRVRVKGIGLQALQINLARNTAEKLFRGDGFRDFDEHRLHVDRRLWGYRSLGLKLLVSRGYGFSRD